MLLGKPTADEELSLEELSKQKLESLFLFFPEDTIIFLTFSPKLRIMTLIDMRRDFMIHF